jgi:hypothetical protein
MGGQGTDLIPVVQRSYDLCAHLHEHVNRFPRAQRGLLGRTMVDGALQMLVSLTVANRRSRKDEALEEASGRLDALRITMRLSKRLGYLSNGGYEDLSRVADEVGRMLGGWIKYESAASAATSANLPSVPMAIRPQPRSAARRSGGVRYTMTSPTIEKYLGSKLEHPQAVVFLAIGVFCQTFFEDAIFCGQTLHLAVRNVAAESEPEKILTCGIPKAKLEKYVALLQQAGREVHVE